MALFTASLNSGSNGNCYYIGNDNEAVLIDAGISCREIEKRMSRNGLRLQHVKGIFISHEHSDHINGLEVLSKRYHIPVYITQKTYRNSSLKIDPANLRFISANETICLGDLTITAFPKLHDAADPCSFIVSDHEVNVGVMTDIGSVCDDVMENFKKCHAAFLEANYDDHMLDNGHYPFVLKKRIKSDVGHLSNAQALELFASHRSSSLSHVFLAHLSKENNSPELAQQLFQQYAGNTEIVVASRYKETAIYKIVADFVFDETVQRVITFEPKAEQLKLF